MTQDYTWLLKELLQYKAELSQGLNELAGNGTPEEQAVRRMYAHIEQMRTEAEAKAYKRGYAAGNATKNYHSNVRVSETTIEAIIIEVEKRMTSKSQEEGNA